MVSANHLYTATVIGTIRLLLKYDWSDVFLDWSTMAKPFSDWAFRHGSNEFWLHQRFSQLSPTVVIIILLFYSFISTIVLKNHFPITMIKTSVLASLLVAVVSASTNIASYPGNQHQQGWWAPGASQSNTAWSSNFQSTPYPQGSGWQNWNTQQPSSSMSHQYGQQQRSSWPQQQQSWGSSNWPSSSYSSSSIQPQQHSQWDTNQSSLGGWGQHYPSQQGYSTHQSSNSSPNSWSQWGSNLLGNLYNPSSQQGNQWNSQPAGSQYSSSFIGPKYPGQYGGYPQQQSYQGSGSQWDQMKHTQSPQSQQWGQSQSQYNQPHTSHSNYPQQGGYGYGGNQFQSGYGGNYNYNAQGYRH